MKKTFILIFTLVLAVTAMMGHSQGMATEDKELILTMQVGDVTYKIPASEIGEMTFTDNGATLIVRGREYKVADIASMSVAEEIPQPKKLTAINYRKGYQWYEPHDNLPLSYQYIVYRDSVFSDGSVHTMESRSSNTAMEWGLGLLDWDYSVGNGQGKEDILGTIVYYFPINFYADDSLNCKASRTVAVPDLSVVTYRSRGTDTRDAHQLDSYLRWIDGKPYQFDVNNPEAGWYTRDFFYYDYGRIYNDFDGGGGFLTQFNTESRW